MDRVNLKSKTDLALYQDAPWITVFVVCRVGEIYEYHNHPNI